METQTIRLEIKNRIALVTINRPEKLNALSTEVFSGITAIFREIAGRGDIGAVVISGEGKAFVAGADISEMRSMDPATAERFSRTGQKCFDMIENFPLPVIAAVNGYALGGGCELAMACDMRIASRKAWFGQPEVNLGLIPGFAGTQRLPRLTGAGNAMWMLLSAETLDAENAFRIGLVQVLTEPEELVATAIKIAGLIASKGPKAVKAAKKVVREGLAGSFDDGCRLESSEFGNLFEDEGIEGMNAFLEKRDPDWNTT